MDTSVFKIISLLLAQGKIGLFIRTHMCSVVSHVQLFVILQTVACQTPLFLGFSRLEYWNGLIFPSLGDLPNPGLNPHLLHSRWILLQPFLSEQTDKILNSVKYLIYVKISLFFPQNMPLQRDVWQSEA